MASVSDITKEPFIPDATYGQVEKEPTIQKRPVTTAKVKSY